MIKEIENLIQNCNVSLMLMYNRANQKETLIPSEVPNKPWDKLGTDIFHLDNEPYLMIIDYYSKYVEIEKLKNEKAETTINSLKTIFSKFGIAKILRSDNGPQFNNKQFKSFANDWNFKHITSNPLYPKSNGKIERHIQTAKRTIKKAIESNRDPYFALLELRNTPISNEIPSPNKLLLGRNVKGVMPDFLFENEHTEVREKLVARQNRQKHYHDIRARDLPELKKGENVIVRNKKGTWDSSKIVNLNNKPRSYNIEMPNGRILTRNRSHLKRNVKTDFIYESDMYYDSPTGNYRTARVNNNTQRQLQPQIEIQENVTPNQQVVSSNNPSQNITRSGRVVKRPTFFENFV